MRLNAQAFVRAELDSALSDADVRVSVPNPRPEKFVLVKREGGAQQDAHRDSPGIGIFCWAKTEAEAADLAMRAAETMLALEYKQGVASVTEEILTSAPEPESGNPRWYGSYSLITYKTKE